MPYCIWLTGHRRYEDVTKGVPDCVTREELNEAVRLLHTELPLKIVRNPDGSIWLFREEEEEPGLAPWLRAFLKADERGVGSIELSISYTNPFFLANMYGMVHGAAWIAKKLSLLAFEEVDGLRVESKTAEKLLAPEGEYLQRQGQFAHRLRGAINTEVRMPFELPSGAVDACTNLVKLRLQLPHEVRPRDVLGEPPAGLAVDSKENRGLLYDPQTNQPVVWVARSSLGPGHFLIWPHWRKAAFLQMAQDAMALAERARARLGGELVWLEEPWTEGQRQWFTEHPSLLGVELYEALTQELEPRPREEVRTRSPGWWWQRFRRVPR